MRYIEDYSDARHKTWCIHCGAVIDNVPVNWDHVPTKSLLSKSLRDRGLNHDRGNDAQDDYLPQVLICKGCNTGFSEDESYLLCLLHALSAESLYPDKRRFPEAAKVLRSNRNIVRQLRATPDGQLPLFENLKPFTLHPDRTKIERIIVKNARGHAYHELGEPLLPPPTYVNFSPLEQLSPQGRARFEDIGGGSNLWPEVGSRMMLQLADGLSSAGGWIEVEPERYRYAVDWSEGISVHTVIWNYLATETRWENAQG